MNNREMAGPISPDADDPAGEDDNRQHQREADHLQGRGVPAAGGQGGFSCRDGDESRFTHDDANWIRGNAGGRGHGTVTLGAGNCGGVNSTAQASPRRSIVAQGKFGMKGLLQMRLRLRSPPAVHGLKWRKHHAGGAKHSIAVIHGSLSATG
jgi:hypothetical protein